MLEEQFEKLNMTEKEQFRRMVNKLLAHSYLLSRSYDFTDHIAKTNPEYLFVERNFELFQEYFSYSAFHLERDNNYGVISLQSEYDENRLRLDKQSTLILYTLRLIYEEEREKLSLSREIFVSVADLVHKMISVGAIRKKPSNLSLSSSLRILSHFRLLEKAGGRWEDADTRLLILPTILFVVSNEQITGIHRLLEEGDGNLAEEEGESYSEGGEELSAEDEGK